MFQLARQYGLKGRVANTGGGVTLVVEGPGEQMAPFCRDIREKAPPLSHVTAVDAVPVAVQGHACFTIEKSRGGRARNTLISPDVAVCDDCLAEMMSPGDRRFAYPFINCTNCGPRYTIIKDLPYDRPATAMASFSMCSQCQKEYDDPMDRRFHAQPNACPMCGPHLFLTDRTGRWVDNGPSDALDRAVMLLQKGHILAVKGLGGFHLAVDATCHAGVCRLRQAKQRPHKPFALMARSVDAAALYVRVSRRERELLMSRGRPIVLLEKRGWSAAVHATDGPGPVLPDRGTTPLSNAVAPGNPFLGVMLPYTPLHHLLLEKGPPMLVMTSGNPGGEPLSIDNAHALDAFSHMADYFLMHNRDIYFRADDSIMQVQADVPRFFRRSRGYAPRPVFLKTALPPVLACGGGLKSTICLVRDNKAFLSQHIGDLDNEKVFAFFRRSVAHLQRILDVTPRIVAHDLHPGYMSSAWAMARKGVKRVAVQHHHAHAVSCMVENNLDEPVIAVTLDGTGLGTDGTIWGGEVLTCSYGAFKRHAHLACLPMPGGDQAVREPWRMAASCLWRVWGDAFVELDLPLIRRIGRDRLTFLARMMARNINSPLTSSAGRLFDAVAALTGLRDTMTYESQAAMDLQAAATAGKAHPVYELKFAETLNAQEPVVLDPLPAVRRMVADIRKGTDAGAVSAGFHAMIIEGFSRAVGMVHRRTGIDKVVLSGGVFNNRRILEGMETCLTRQGMGVYTHCQVPTGDGGISLGQAVIAGISATPCKVPQPIA